MKKFTTLLITLLTALLLLSCNANKVEENAPVQPQPKEKIKCYIYQTRCLDEEWIEHKEGTRPVFKTEPVTFEGKTIEYWKGPFGYAEKEVGNPYFYFHISCDIYHAPYFLLEVDPDDVEWENGPNRNKFLNYITGERIMYNETNDTYYRPAHWGVPVKVGETEDRVFYAIAPITEIDENYCTVANSSCKPANPKLRLESSDRYYYTKGIFYVYNANYKSCNYSKTLDDGTEIYEAYWQVGDELVYAPVTSRVTYFHPELKITFTFADIAYRFRDFDMENNGSKIGETIFDAYHWTFQGYFKEEIGTRETDIPAKWMKPWDDLRII